MIEAFHGLFRHIDIFEHNFKSCGEDESTLLFEFRNNQFFCVRILAKIFKKALGEARFIISFKDIFISDEPEYLDNSIDNFLYFIILHHFESFLELFIQIRDKSHRSAVIQVYELLECASHRYFKLLIVFERFVEQEIRFLPHFDEFAHELFVL